MTEQLTQDEFTVLLIAQQGQWLAPIGRWEEPINALFARGLMLRHDRVNYGITQQGRDAVAEREKQDDQVLGRALENYHVASSVQAPIRDFAEQAAQLLAQAARASALVTGDDHKIAAKKWSDTILWRALELL